MPNQHARALPLEVFLPLIKLADWTRVPSLFEVCTYENIAC